MAKRQTALVVLVAFAAAGCASFRQNTVACKVTTLLVPAAVGAAGAGVGFAQIENTPSNGEIAAASAAGFVAGGIIGAIAGHFICQKEEEPVAAPPPPPPPPPPPAKGTKIAELTGPHFEFDKSRLTPEGRARVDEAARTLQDHPDVRVSVDGYTDSIGSDAYNQKLSERRARTVADRLTEQGVSPSRLTVRGFGESNPIASNSTSEGRARNRRVEIVVQ